MKRSLFLDLAGAIGFVLCLSVSLASSADNQTSPSKPTAMVVIQEKVMGIFGGTGWEVPTQSETTLISLLRAQGFSVLDPTTVRNNVEQAKGLRMIEGDNLSAANIGLQNQSQISIVGSAYTKFAGTKLFGTQMQSIQAVVTARAIQNDTGQVIATGSANAVQAHIDELQGGVLALEAATRDLASQLIPKINQARSGDGSGIREVVINVSNLKSYRHLDFILYYFEENLPGATSVFLRDFTNNVATIDLRFNNRTEVMGREIANNQFSGFRLEPVNVTENRIDLSVVANP